MCWIFIPVDKISWQETKVSGPVLRSILVGDVALWCPETSGISVKKIIECNIKNTKHLFTTCNNTMDLPYKINKLPRDYKEFSVVLLN